MLRCFPNEGRYWSRIVQYEIVYQNPLLFRKAEETQESEIYSTLFFKISYEAILAKISIKWVILWNHKKIKNINYNKLSPGYITKREKNSSLLDQLRE